LARDSGQCQPTEKKARAKKGVIKVVNTAEKILKKAVYKAGGFTDHIQLNELPYCKPIKKWLIQVWKRSKSDLEGNGAKL
jgi:hypothetical protein